MTTTHDTAKGRLLVLVSAFPAGVAESRGLFHRAGVTFRAPSDPNGGGVARWCRLFLSGFRACLNSPGAAASGAF